MFPSLSIVKSWYQEMLLLYESLLPNLVCIFPVVSKTKTSEPRCFAFKNVKSSTANNFDCVLSNTTAQIAPKELPANCFMNLPLGSNSCILLFSRSATYTLPLLSKEMPCGMLNSLSLSPFLPHSNKYFPVAENFITLLFLQLVKIEFVEVLLMVALPAFIIRLILLFAKLFNQLILRRCGFRRGNT